MPTFNVGVNATSRAVTVTDDWFGLHADGTRVPTGPHEQVHFAGVEAGPGSTIERSLFPIADGFAIYACGGGSTILDNRIGIDADGHPAGIVKYGIEVDAACNGKTSNPATTVVGQPGHG